MDANFWWGIVGGIAVTIVIGLPLNFLANIYTPSLTEAWNRRRSNRQERSKAKAMAAYKFVSDLRSGQKDKYAHLLKESVSLLFFLLMTLVLFVTATLALVLLLVQKSGENSIPISTIFGAPDPIVAALLAVVVGMLAAIGAFYTSSRTQILNWRLENFNEYKAQIESRWGPIT